MPLIKIRHRRDSTATWNAANTVLESGELGLEVSAVNADGSLKFLQENGQNKALFKLGDGKTPWKSLPYASGPQGLKGDKGDKGDGSTVLPPISDSTTLADSGVYASAKAVNTLRSSQRTPCTGGRYIYVRANGNDNNDGLTVATAKLTFPGAASVLHSLDARGNTVVIDIGPGDFTIDSYLFLHSLNAFASYFIIQGAGKDVTRLLNPTGWLLQFYGVKLTIRDLFISGAIIAADGAAIDLTRNIGIGNITSNYRLLHACRGGSIIITAPEVDVCGQARALFHAYDSGHISVFSSGIKFINAVFSAATCEAYTGGCITWSSAYTHTGTVTGRKFIVDAGGVLHGDTTLPGSIGGTIGTNGIIGAKVLDHTHPAPEITGTAKAWGAVASNGVIKDSEGVASITKTTTATYAVAFSSPAPHANYAVTVQPTLYSSYVSAAMVTSKTTTGFVIQTYYHQTTSMGRVDVDFDFTVHW